MEDNSQSREPLCDQKFPHTKVKAKINGKSGHVYSYPKSGCKLTKDYNQDLRDYVKCMDMVVMDDGANKIIVGCKAYWKN